MEEPTRCNDNNLLISKISSTCFGQSLAHLQERKTEIFTAYGILLIGELSQATSFIPYT